MDHPELPEGLTVDMSEAFIRPEVVAAARARLAAGQEASALQVADALLEPYRDSAEPYPHLPAAS